MPNYDIFSAPYIAKLLFDVSNSLKVSIPIHRIPS